MQVITRIAELRGLLNAESDISFVPTMGSLHEGHLNLVRLAREGSHCVVVSIFVNPLQFGANEDFDHYPRSLEADCLKLQGLADIVFAPSLDEMYSEPQDVFIELPSVANEMCGAIRPGHFRGMATVVLKLLNIVQPKIALFGKKDYQQLHIIRLLVTQLNLPIRIVGIETIRAIDGLALSSRNQYLNKAQRNSACFLYEILQRAHDQILEGKRTFRQIEIAAVAALVEQGWMVDYVEIRNQKNLKAADESVNELVILGAARLGGVRLIDNIEVRLTHQYDIIHTLVEG